MAAIFAFVLFLGNVAIEVLGDDLKESLKPYRFWVWLVLAVSLLVTVVGAVRERSQGDGGVASDNVSGGAGSIVTRGNVTESNQITGSGNTIHQSKGGNANSSLSLSIDLSGRTPNNTAGSEHSGVHWEERDVALLREFFSKCAVHDGVYAEHERWQDRDIRERLLNSGLAAKDPHGQTYLTRDGVLLCCQKGKIPLASFHVDVRFKQLTTDEELAIQFNGCSVLLLYNHLLKELTPLFERGVEHPGIRDEYGGVVSVFDYPKIAIIEALVNFLIHRDYSEDDMASITIYPDKVVFENPGESDFPINKLLTATEPLLPKYLRNQRLIHAFNVAHLNQREGRGLQRIRKALTNNGSIREDGSPALEVDSDSNLKRFRLTIYRRVPTSNTVKPALPRNLGILPPHPPLIFVGRDEAITDVMRVLGVGSPVGAATERVVVVRGWPGVGKTSFVSSLSHHPEMMRAYPDGVLWTSLGTDPNLIAILASWGRALGRDDLMGAGLVEDAVRELGILLQSRRMLLIVDDVWESAHGALFQSMMGQHCGLLITTRLTKVAEELVHDSRSVYQLPVLSEDDALNLMRILAPAVVAEHPDECRELVRDLECLPLALHVASALLRVESQLGLGVAELLEHLRQGETLVTANAPRDRIESSTIPTVHALLNRSTDVLDEHTRDCFVFLGAFAPKPATFDLNAMKAVWRVEDPRPIVRNLVNHGLLESLGNGRFQMHALLVAHAQSLLGADNEGA